jgi:hypothetical protein
MSGNCTLHRAITGAAVALTLAAACGDDSGPTDPSDTTPPSVSLSASDVAVTGNATITLTADANDNVGVVSVTFHDGASVIGMRTSAPWSLDVAVTAAANGRHLYRATAKDAAGNEAQSANVAVDVAIPNLPLLDDFNDNLTDSTQWVKLPFGQGPVADETGGRMVITIPANTTGGGASEPGVYLSLRCRLTGDVDVQVDFTLVTWPEKSGVRLGLSAYTTGGAVAVPERVGFASGDFTGVESYVSHHAPGAILTFATSDTEGTLRVTRSGGTFTSYYWNGAAWEAMQTSAVSPAEEVSMNFGAWTPPAKFAGVETIVAFDNFKVNAGQMGSCD